jgi:hypothetical protein
MIVRFDREGIRMNEVSRIAFEDLANNLAIILHRVVSENAVIVVETSEGELAVLRALAPSELPEKSEAEVKAFRSAAGSWADLARD